MCVCVQGPRRFTAATHSMRSWAARWGGRSRRDPDGDRAAPPRSRPAGVRDVSACVRSGGVNTRPAGVCHRASLAALPPRHESPRWLLACGGREGAAGGATSAASADAEASGQVSGRRAARVCVRVCARGRHHIWRGQSPHVGRGQQHCGLCCLCRLPSRTARALGVRRLGGGWASLLLGGGLERIGRAGRAGRASLADRRLRAGHERAGCHATS